MDDVFFANPVAASSPSSLRPWMEGLFRRSRRSQQRYPDSARLSFFRSIKEEIYPISFSSLPDGQPAGSVGCADFVQPLLDLFDIFLDEPFDRLKDGREFFANDLEIVDLCLRGGRCR